MSATAEQLAAVDAAKAAEDEAGTAWMHVRHAFRRTHPEHAAYRAAARALTLASRNLHRALLAANRPGLL